MPDATPGASSRRQESEADTPYRKKYRPPSLAADHLATGDRQQTSVNGQGGN
jgi:hypothetical protein